jgi:hypothetical protein
MWVSLEFALRETLISMYGSVALDGRGLAERGLLLLPRLR